MTNEQIERVKSLRNKGCGYKAIAEDIGIGKDTVKSYCRRNNLAGERASHTPIKRDVQDVW